MNWLIASILIIVVGTNLILFSNLIYFRRLDQFPQTKKKPKISVLLPARDEQKNIEACVISLLHQDYPNFEVIVLDDESSDETPNILNRLAAENKKLKTIKGKPLPHGWMGKNWACYQLSLKATGEYLLFTDADTIHHSKTLQEGISAILAQEADLLTAIPYERLESFGEKLLLPYIFFSALALMPIGLAHRWRFSSMCFAIGQFMLFKKSAYFHIGGHKAIHNILMEDLTLGRRIKTAGLRWRMVDGGRRIQCRMYDGFKETWHGLTRFMYLGYENHIVNLLFVWLFTGVLFLTPVILIIMYLSGFALSPAEVIADLVAIGLTLFLWAASYIRLRFPGVLAILYPFTFIMNFIVTIYSMISTRSGQTTWKGRNILKPDPGTNR